MLDFHNITNDACNYTPVTRDEVAPLSGRGVWGGTPLKAEQATVTVYLTGFADGTWEVTRVDHTCADAEGFVDLGRTDMVGIALTRVLRAAAPWIEVKVSPPT